MSRKHQQLSEHCERKLAGTEKVIKFTLI